MSKKLRKSHNNYELSLAAIQIWRMIFMWTGTQLLSLLVTAGFGSNTNFLLRDWSQISLIKHICLVFLDIKCIFLGFWYWHYIAYKYCGQSMLHDLTNKYNMIFQLIKWNYRGLWIKFVCLELSLNCFNTGTYSYSHQQIYVWLLLILLC